MLFHEQKTFNSFQKTVKTSEKAVRENKNLTNEKTEN